MKRCDWTKGGGFLLSLEQSWLMSQFTNGDPERSVETETVKE